MSQSTAAALVRVSVSSGTRRADLGLPGGVPVVEIVPELARELGVLDPGHASLGYRLLAADGSVLDPDLGLAAQGVADGAVLALEVADPDTQRVYDDVVEAVADVVESQFAPWTPRHSAGTAVGAAVVLFLCTAWALFTARDAGLVVVASAGAAALLLVAAAAVLQARDEAVGALALAGPALVLAAVAGTAVRPGEPLWGAGLVATGPAVAAVALLAALAVSAHRPVLAAVAALGVLATLVGVVTEVAGADLTAASAVLFGLAVVAGNVLPWAGLTSSRLSPHTPRTEAEISADVPGVDRDLVRARVVRGHDVMAAVAVATGGAALLATPQLAASGPAGTVLAATGFTATLLRTRHGRTRTTVLLATGTGILGLAAAAVVAAASHPGWRPALALALGTGGALVVALALLAPRTRVRLGRAADVLDGVTLVALVPLVALTVGVL